MSNVLGTVHASNTVEAVVEPPTDRSDGTGSATLLPGVMPQMPLSDGTVNVELLVTFGPNTTRTSPLGNSDSWKLNRGVAMPKFCMFCQVTVVLVGVLLRKMRAPWPVPPTMSAY